MHKVLRARARVDIEEQVLLNTLLETSLGPAHDSNEPQAANGSVKDMTNDRNL